MMKPHGWGEEIDFSVLDLSVRAKHCLERNGIDTYGILAELKEADILSFKNAGGKTVAEIMSIIEELDFKGLPEEVPVEILEIAEPVMSGEIDFAARGFSKRAETCLVKSGIDKLESLMGMTEDDINKIPCAGKKTVMELLEIIAELKREAFFSWLRAYGMSKDTCSWLELNGIFTMHKLLSLGCTETDCAGAAVSNEVNNYIREIKAGRLEEKKGLAIKLAEQMGTCFGECRCCLPKFKIQQFIDTIQGDLQHNSEILERFVETEQLDISQIARNSFLCDWIAKRPVMKWILKEPLLVALDSPFGKSMEEAVDSLSETVPSFFVKPEIVRELLVEMEEDGVVADIDSVYRVVRPRIRDVLRALQINPRDIEVLELRLSGAVLQEIGDVIGVTRERARQIIIWALKSVPAVFEDRLSEIYGKYAFDANALKQIFSLDEMSANYMALRYVQGRITLSDAIDDVSLPRQVRRTIERYCYRDFLDVDGEHLRRERSAIIDYILRKFCRADIGCDDVAVAYERFLFLFGLEQEEDLQYSSRYFETRLANSWKVLWTHGKRLRYYDIGSVDMGQLLEDLHFEEFNGMEISTDIFFKRFPQIMEELDIRDCYELHNLLKKREADINGFNVTFLRMPGIVIGEASRDEQVMELLRRESPVSIEDFVDMYAEEYGVSKGSIMANYLEGAMAYRKGDILSLDVEKLEYKEIQRIQGILVKDIYPLSVVKQLYKKLFPAEHRSLLNVYNMRACGFKMTTKTVFSARYTNLADAVEAFFAGQEIVRLGAEERELFLDQSFANHMYSMKRDYEIIEFEPYSFIHIKRFLDRGITKEDLRQYCSDVADLAGSKYFTVHSP